MKSHHNCLSDVERIHDLRRTIQNKAGLKAIYERSYFRFKEMLDRCPDSGVILEIGSGGGFLKSVVPEAITSDVLPYAGLDQVIDARHLPFEDASLRAIFMLNTFHHIPSVEKFLREAQRCLKPGGRIFIVDQNPGWISKWILKYAHHEAFLPDSENWDFPEGGALESANGALPWMVFHRDLSLFTKKFPELQLRSYRPHTPLLYWVSGGLKQWNLCPRPLLPLADAFDSLFMKVHPQFGSFLDIEVEKRARR